MKTTNNQKAKKARDLYLKLNNGISFSIHASTLHYAIQKTRAALNTIHTKTSDKIIEKMLNDANRIYYHFVNNGSIIDYPDCDCKDLIMDAVKEYYIHESQKEFYIIDKQIMDALIYKAINKSIYNQKKNTGRTKSYIINTYKNGNTIIKDKNGNITKVIPSEIITEKKSIPLFESIDNANLSKKFIDSLVDRNTDLEKTNFKNYINSFNFNKMEMDIVKLLDKNYLVKEILIILDISNNTYYKYLNSIKSKIEKKQMEAKKSMPQKSIPQKNNTINKITVPLHYKQVKYNLFTETPLAFDIDAKKIAIENKRIAIENGIIKYTK